MIASNIYAQTLPAWVNQDPILKKEIEKINVKGSFLSDSIKIGLPVYYVLKVKYPTQIQLVFPDTNYNFQPFTLLKKRYFPTKTTENQSVDSAVYEFTTFEINKIQKMQLPVYVVGVKDSFALMPTPDSVFLVEMVKAKDLVRTPPKTILKYQPVQEYFNYPYLISALLIVLIVILVIWGLLGNQIIKAYQMFQFRTRHAIFIKEYNRLITRVLTRQSAEDIEKALGLWKKHLEYVENQPFSTYTSKEIGQVVSDNTLVESLKNIDKAIYGKEISEEIGSSLSNLRNFSINRYEKKREKLRNA
jgi:hypothetical protein